MYGALRTVRHSLLFQVLCLPFKYPIPLKICTSLIYAQAYFRLTFSGDRKVKNDMLSTVTILNVYKVLNAMSDCSDHAMQNA